MIELWGWGGIGVRAFAIFVPELCSLRGARAEKNNFLFWKKKKKSLILWVDEAIVLLPLWNNDWHTVNGWFPVTLCVSIFKTGRKSVFVTVYGLPVGLGFLTKYM